jgi:hypothetical protein
MICDLRAILDGWDYEPGKISVRKIIGREGREKVQTRIDLGVLQFETTGRPDGTRPLGYESYLEYHEKRLLAHVRDFGDDSEFVLTPEQCRDLRHEAYLYYQRYLSFFVLEEYDNVIRDTERNLTVVDLCRRYAGSEFDRDVLEQQRTYVMMMLTRAKTYQALQNEAYEAALTIIDKGITAIQEVVAETTDDANRDTDNEIRVLDELKRETLEQMPDDCPAKLRWELGVAVRIEDYEKAAELRDRLSSAVAGGETVSSD